MTNLTDWLTQARDRADAATAGPWHMAHARTDLPAALDAIQAATSHETARRIVAMTHQITPEELTSDDLWLVQEVEQILAAAIATALGVSEP